LVISFGAVGLWCFVGVFEKSGGFDVVFWWCECGVLRGWRGVLAVTFLSGKNVTGFRGLFWGFPFWEL
jgi:hypothetical protein